MSYDDLEKLLDEYNWDDGFEIPKEILSNPYCDLALALKIFYLADGFAYLDGFAEKGRLDEWEQFIYSLYNNILPSVDKGTHAPNTVFWRLAALTSIGVRPVRLIPLPCQPPKYGTWGPKEFCASDL